MDVRMVARSSAGGSGSPDRPEGGRTRRSGRGGREAGSAAAVLPVAGAIGAFGVVYGAAAEPVLGAPLTLLSSASVFSGAGQFAMVGLLGAGASAAAVLWAVTVLNLRHLALGALVRQRLGDASVAQRAMLAWFLIDETAGLGLAAEGSEARTIRSAGVACYLAFSAGTALGLAGAVLPQVEDLAAAVMPVLFVGLAAVMTQGRADVTRAGSAAAAVALVLVAAPGAGSLAPVAAAVAVAAIGARR